MKMNLQLFAEEEINQEGINVEEPTLEVETEEKTEEVEEINQEEKEVNTETEEVEEVETQEEENQEDDKMVPLKALKAEREKWKQRLEDPKIQKALKLAEQLEKTTGKDYDSILKELEQIEIQNHIQKGVDPQHAQWLVQQQREIQEVKRALNKQKRDTEIAQLKQDPFFSDIDNYRDEIEVYADKTGLTLEQAYMAVRGKQRMVEYQRELEQRILNNIHKKQSKKIDTTSNGEVEVQSKVKLTAEEREFAKMAGMTEQEYYALKYMSNPDEYKKYKNRR